MAKDTKAQLRRFIEKYYYQQLLDVVKKGKHSLIIDFSTLSKFSLSLAEQLLDQPVETIKAAEDAIQEFDIPEVTWPIRVRLTGLPKSQYIRIRDIRSAHLSKLIMTDGLIRQASDVRPRITLATFECGFCGAQILVEQVGTRFQEPVRCQCGRKAKFNLIDKKMVDVQRLLIEESPEILTGGEQPKRIAAFLSEDLLDPAIEKKRYPGNKVNLIGVVKEVQVPLRTGGKSTTYDLFIDTNSIETIEEEFEEIQINKEDEKVIKELAAKPNVYEKLVRSIAPSIYGYDNVKEAIALQLFSGVQKVREDGTRTRGDIHIFLVGDPGSGKSEILRYVSTLAPKARYIAGKGATAAGLTATVVKDEFMRGWALEAGALVLCHKGLACLDELDKMSPEDRGAMHEALEQQIVSISKANIQATLRAETSVLAASNPKFGRFDPYSSISAQIDLPVTLINRFDLIFPIRDIPNVELDEKIARHILELQREPTSKKPEIESALLRKYIAYAKQHCYPTLTIGALEEIKNFYISLRSAAATAEGEIKAIPISARQLEALVRLAEASARIKLSDKVTKKDAQRAIALLKSCMEAVAIDFETGRFDIDRITTGITATQRSRISIIRRIIDDLEAKIGKSIPVSDVLDTAEAEGVEKAKAEEIIDNLKKKGDIFEPKPGLIQKVG